MISRRGLQAKESVALKQERMTLEQGGDEEEAVRLANDTVYGLGANVWTADPERGQRVASRLRAGQVGVYRYRGGAPGTAGDCRA